MAKSKNPVNTQMGGAFTSRHTGIQVGGHEAVTKVEIGKGGIVTPTQTAGHATRTPRSGAKQFSFGKSNT